MHSLLGNPASGFYVVADEGGRVVGSLLITKEWSDWRNGDYCEIQSVYVRPEFRRRGVYKALYRYVQELAAQDPKVCGFRLYVERENDRAQGDLPHTRNEGDALPGVRGAEARRTLLPVEHVLADARHALAFL